MCSRKVYVQITARQAPSTTKGGPPIPGQSRVVSYRLRTARLCSLALCDRRSLKTLINRFQLHYLPDGGRDENSSFLPSFRADESSNRELRLYREESDFRQQPKSSCFRGAFTYHVFLGTFGARLKHLNQCSYKMEILRTKAERHG